MKLTMSEKSNSTKVVLSNSISKFGDILFDYVNSVWLTGIQNGGNWLTLYQSSETVVGVVTNIFGGVLSDSYDRKRITWICDLMSGMCCILLGIFIPQRIFIYSVVVINIILSCLSSIRSPAYKAVFREIVSVEKIGKVNSILETFSQCIKISGPIVASLIASHIGNRNSLLLDGVSFIISAALMSRLIILTDTDHKPVKNPRQFVHQCLEGIKYLSSQRTILLIVIFSTLVNFVLAGYNLALPFANFAFPSISSKTYAVFLGTEAIGGLIGAGVSAFIRREPTAGSLITTILVSGLALLPSKFIFLTFRNPFAPAVCIFSFNVFLSIFNIQFMTFVQSKTDVNYLGRVFSIIFSIAILFMPIGTIIFNKVLDLKSNSNYSLFGLLLIIISLLTLMTTLVTNIKSPARKGKQ